jgi:DNA-binding beta-propeller fold protein YncE
MQATPRDPLGSNRHPMRTAASACVSCALGCALLASCTASAEDVRPPPDQLFFPSGLAVTPPGNPAAALFVANANSELRYDSGSINVIGLEVVKTAVTEWLTHKNTMGCLPDPDHRETLVCDEKPFIREGAGVRIGNFATDIAVQDFTDSPTSPTKLRVFVPTRGDPSIAWADYDGDRLSCSTEDGFAQCDDQHRLSSVLNDPNQAPVTDEPFAVFATTQAAEPGGTKQGFAIVTHLTTGSITLVDAPEDGTVQISDVAIGLFAADLATGLRGSTGVAARKVPRPEDPTKFDDMIYVGSRTDRRIQTLTVGRPENGAVPYLLPASYFFLDAVGLNAGNSIDTRGIQFSPSGDRLYVVNRRPPSLQIYDTTLGPGGVPNNNAVGASDICRQASSVAVMDAGSDTDPQERAYVTCFQDGVVYVVDPRGQSQVEDIITVGRGPYAIAGAKDQKLIFVSNVLEDTIAVIDVDPASATRNRVVLRIGQPRQP